MCACREGGTAIPEPLVTTGFLSEQAQLVAAVTLSESAGSGWRQRNCSPGQLDQALLPVSNLKTTSS